VEKEAADTLRIKHHLFCHKLPISYRIDWIVWKAGSNKLHGFIELKGRNNAHNTYPTLILSLAKYAAGCNLARITNTPFWVGVRWTDMLAFCRADDFVPEVQMGGRTDRGDSADIEPVVHLPAERFKDSPVP